MPRVDSERDLKPVFDPFVEDVNGVVIGDPREDESRYRFYTLDGRRIHYDELWFADDAAAAAWFREHYPEYCKAGAEMRCYYP